jgi:DUF4097 and DUF4098 domain-containing protein YvlB
MIAALVVAMMAATATDQTVDVAKGTKLNVNNFAGDVIIKTWGRDAVRVEVNHSDRETVDIKQVEQTLSVRSRSTRGGPSRSLDYTITVPAWMGISVNGTYADVTAEGVGGDVAVETTHGDITIRGGSGFISLKTVQGAVIVEKAKGRVEVRAVNEGIHLADLNADLSAESTNGSIILDRIESSNVDLYTVNGNISYDGAVKDKGLYRLTTHNGLIAMPIAERSNVTLSARTYNGGIRSSFTLPTDPNVSSERRNKRVNLTIGNGSAHVELESFSGTISLRRPGEPRPETERRRRDRGDDADKEREKEREKAKAKGEVGRAGLADHDFDFDSLNIEAAVAEAMAAAEASIPEAIAAAEASIPEAIAEALAWTAAHPLPSPHIMPAPTPHPAPQPRPATLSFRQQRGNGRSGPRVDQIRGNFREWLQHEPPLAESWVWHHQPRLVDHRIPIENQIEIERAGCIRAGRPQPIAAPLLFDAEQDIEQLARRQQRSANRRGVEEQRLWTADAERRGLDVARHFELANHSLQAGDRMVEMPHSIPEVAAECDGNERVRRTFYSSQRLGSTSPCEGPRTSARRPSKSVRPASAWSKNRFCSRTSPRIRRSILACRALTIVSSRARHRSTNAWASLLSFVENRARRRRRPSRACRAPVPAGGRSPCHRARRSPSPATTGGSRRD